MSISSITGPARPGLTVDPQWYRTAVFYEVLVRAFADSTGSGSGDFRGLIGKLDYLQWLGVDCIWVPPFYASPLRDGGYDIADYRSVLPEFGSVADFRDLPEGKGGVFLVVWPLEAGFTAPGLAVISEQDVLGDRLVAKPRRKRKAENFLREVDTLSPGDLVVHVEHGVGRYLGIETITALGAPHACVMLEYAENAKLYLPVENIELLSRYGHEEGLLDRLGGQGFCLAADLSDPLAPTRLWDRARRRQVASPPLSTTQASAAKCPSMPRWPTGTPPGPAKFR